MSLGVASDLIYGNLQLQYPSGEKIFYVATSGCPGWQQPDDEWTIARGPIPRGQYEIPTTPYWSDVRGIEGNFFHITPDPVSNGDIVRGEFGVHFDANVPGSSGCIVLRNRDGFDTFCDRLSKIAAEGVQSIPLSVRYS